MTSSWDIWWRHHTFHHVIWLLTNSLVYMLHQLLYKFPYIGVYRIILAFMALYRVNLITPYDDVIPKLPLWRHSDDDVIHPLITIYVFPLLYRKFRKFKILPFFDLEYPMTHPLWRHHILYKPKFEKSWNLIFTLNNKSSILKIEIWSRGVTECHVIKLNVFV